MRQYRHNNQCLSFREAWPHSDADLTLIDNSPSRRPQHPSIVAGRRFSQSSIGRVVPLLKVSAQSDAVSADGSENCGWTSVSGLTIYGCPALLRSLTRNPSNSTLRLPRYNNIT